MKRAIAIAAGILITVCANAQTLDGYFIPAGTTDTITNTESDTITISSNLLSAWSYNWTVQMSQLSGTSNISITVQESASKNGTDWITIGTDSITGTSGTKRIVGALVYGQRQRIIITGTGSQSTRYTVYTVYKKVFK